jgi:hypothetical protein
MKEFISLVYKEENNKCLLTFNKKSLIFKNKDKIKILFYIDNIKKLFLINKNNIDYIYDNNLNIILNENEQYNCKLIKENNLPSNKNGNILMENKESILLSMAYNLGFKEILIDFNIDYENNIIKNIMNHFVTNGINYKLLKDNKNDLVSK